MNFLKLFILLVFSFQLIPSLAAQNISWTSRSNEWRYDYVVGGFPGTNSYITLEVLDEIIDIDGRKCSVLRPSSPVEEFIVNDGEDIIIWEDEDGIIYRYVDSAFYLLYDFNLEVGDTYEVYVPFAAEAGFTDPFVNLRVDSVETKIINGLAIQAQFVTAIGGVVASFEGWNYEYFGNLDYYFVPINPINCDGACPEGQRCFSSEEEGYSVNFTNRPCNFTATENLTDVSDVFRVYPNPVGGSQEVLMELPLELVTEETRVVLVNQLGQSVFEQKLSRSTAANRLTLPSLSVGVYYLMWESSTARARKKLVLFK